jgi:hypothetical protein
MLKQDGISPKLYGAVIGGALIWVVQALLHIDANTVDIIKVGSQNLTLAGLLTTAGVTLGSFIAPHAGVVAVPPDESQIDPDAGNPVIPAGTE